MPRPSSATCRTWRLQRRWGDRAAEGKAYGNLGCAYELQGDFSKAIKYHVQDLAVANEVGNRAAEGEAYGNLVGAYHSEGDYSKAIEYHVQDLAIAKEVGDRAGECEAYGKLVIAYDSEGGYSRAGRTGTSATHMIRFGTMPRPSSTTGRAWRLQRRRATGRGRANIREPRHRVLFVEGLFQGHGVPHGQNLAIAKEVGDRAGEGTGTSGLRISGSGTSARPSNTTRLQRR
jgi:hypothetical protein